MITQSFVSDDLPETPHIRLGLYQGYGTAGNMDAVRANLSVLQDVAKKAAGYSKSNAYHNNIFCAYSNRRGVETLGEKPVGGYLGNSCLADPHGNFLIPVLALPPKREDQPNSGWNDHMLLMADCVPAFYGPTHPETKIHDRSAATRYINDRRWNLYGQLVSPERVDQETGETRKYPEQPE